MASHSYSGATYLGFILQSRYVSPYGGVQQDLVMDANTASIMASSENIVEIINPTIVEFTMEGWMEASSDNLTIPVLALLDVVMDGEEYIQPIADVILRVIRPTITAYQMYGNLYLGGYNQLSLVGKSVADIYAAITSNELSLSSDNFVESVKVTSALIASVVMDGTLYLGSDNAVALLTNYNNDIYGENQTGVAYISSDNVVQFVNPIITAFEMAARKALLLSGEMVASTATPYIYAAEMALNELVASGEMSLQDATDVLESIHETWALCNLAFDITMYSNWNFNSYALHNSQYYGAQSDGIYILEGTDDDGDDFHPGVQIGPHDFGTANLKQIRTVYAPGCGDKALCRVTGERTKEETLVELERDKFVPSREVLDRWVNIFIVDFEELSRIEIMPVITMKR